MTIFVSSTTVGEDFGQLQEELFARGFDYLNQDTAGQTRAKRWLNEAYVEDICDVEPWPFLEATVSGTAPLTAESLRDVLAVTDTTNGRRLESLDVRDVIDLDTDAGVSTTGTPWGYWIDGVDLLTVYPVQAVELAVRYIAVPDELTSDGDLPLVPPRFRGLIVDGAVIRALKDSDNWTEATAAQQFFDMRLDRMRDSLFSRNFDNSTYVVRTGVHDG